MASRQIVTCDGCEREESCLPTTWWKTNVPTGFMTGDLSEKTPTQADLCPECFERAAEVFCGYRNAKAKKAAKAALAKQIKASLPTAAQAIDGLKQMMTEAPEPSPVVAAAPQECAPRSLTLPAKQAAPVKTTLCEYPDGMRERAKWGERTKAIISALRAGASTATEIAMHAAVTRSYVRYAMATLIERGEAYVEPNSNPSRYVLADAVRNGDRPHNPWLRTPHRRRRGKVLVATQKAPGIAQKILEALSTGPTTLDDLVKALAPAPMKSVRTGLWNLRRDRAVTVENNVWRLLAAS